jgi:hypothetical protein
MGFAMALPWLKKFGPWIVVGLVALGVWAAAKTLVKDWKKSIHDTAFSEGVKKESDRQDAIARRVEEILSPKLANIDDNTRNNVDKQSKREIVYADRIHTQIKNNPVYSSCAVDDSVLRDRNAIRESLQAALNSPLGADAGGTPAAPAGNQ